MAKKKYLDAVYEVGEDKNKQRMSYAELNNKIFSKTSSNFLSMLRNLGVGEEMYHMEMQLKIKRVS